jgi:hypothetical protein
VRQRLCRYVDPSRAARPGAGGTPVGDRGGRAAPPDFAGAGDWPLVAAAAAPCPGIAPSSTAAHDRRGGTRRTPTHRRGLDTIVVGEGLARRPPSPLQGRGRQRIAGVGSSITLGAASLTGGHTKPRSPR